MFAGGFEFAVALGVDGGLAAGEVVGGGDVAEGAVQAFGVVMRDESSHDAVGVGLRERGLLANGVVFEGAVPAFDLAVALGIVG